MAKRVVPRKTGSKIRNFSRRALLAGLLVVPFIGGDERRPGYGNLQVASSYTSVLSAARERLAKVVEETKRNGAGAFESAPISASELRELFPQILEQIVRKDIETRRGEVVAAVVRSHATNKLELYELPNTFEDMYAGYLRLIRRQSEFAHRMLAVDLEKSSMPIASERDLLLHFLRNPRLLKSKETYSDFEVLLEKCVADRTGGYTRADFSNAGKHVCNVHFHGNGNGFSRGDLEFSRELPQLLISGSLLTGDVHAFLAQGGRVSDHLPLGVSEKLPFFYRQSIMPPQVALRDYENATLVHAKTDPRDCVRAYWLSEKPGAWERHRVSGNEAYLHGFNVANPAHQAVVITENHAFFVVSTGSKERVLLGGTH